MEQYAISPIASYRTRQKAPWIVLEAISKSF